VEYCYIFLGSSLDISQSPSLTIDKDGEILAPLKARNIVELVELHQNRQTILVVPCECVSIYHLKLPNLSYNKAKTAIEFALEPLLPQSIANVHLTYVYDKTSQEYTVVVIDKRKLKAIIDQILAFKLHINNLVIDAVLLNTHEALYTDKRLIINTPAFQGVIPKNFETLYEENLSNLKYFTTEELPDFLNKQASLEVTMLDVDPKIWLGKKLLSVIPLNLCHGEFSISLPRQSMINYYYLMFALLPLWLISYFSFNLVMLHQENTKIIELDQKITTYYKQLFPNAGAVLNPKFRVEQLVKKYQQNTSPFWQILKELSSLPINLKTMNYNHNTLTISFSLQEFSQLEKYKQQLSKAGLQVKQIEATQQGKSINAKLGLSA